MVPLLVALLDDAAAAAPERTAIGVPSGPSLTYGAWAARVDGAAAAMRELGVGRCDRVLAHLEPGAFLQWAVLILAVQRIGATLVPTTTRSREGALASVLASATPRLVVSDVWDGPEASVPTTSASALTSRPAQPVKQAVVAGHQLASILYTSGTTGEAKGVACPHDTVTFPDASFQPSYAANRLLHAFPLDTVACQISLVEALVGGEVWVLAGPTGPAVLDAIAERQIASLAITPVLATRLVAELESVPRSLPSLARVVVSSAPSPPSLLARLCAQLPGVELYNHYTLTEAGTAGTRQRFDPERPTSVGLPVPGTTIRIRDVDDPSVDLLPGAVGEVWLETTGATRSYFGEPTASADVFAAKAVRTGDVGFVDADGHLHLVDRKKDLILSGGLNIGTLEVETALLEVPGVSEAAVFGIPDALLGEVPVGVVVGDAVDADTARALVRDRLGAEKAPVQVRTLPALTRTPSGKVDKRALRAWWLALEDRTVAASVASRTVS